MLTYGLDTFDITDTKNLNNALAALVAKHFPDRKELGAMMLADAIDCLAQKIDAVEDGRSGGFTIHPGIEADALDALFAHGMTRKVKLAGGVLRRSAVHA